MKRTLVVTHVMPLELEMFERFITYYKEGFKYLDENIIIIGEDQEEKA